MSNENMNEALDWSSTIEQESEFILLPEGEYSFTVESMERARFNGSEKMSACPVANLVLNVYDEQGNSAKVYESLFLHRKAEWKLSQFFISIGQKKKGEPLNPNWNMVPGSTGKLELTVNEYSKNGETRKNNRVARYLPKEQRKYVPGNF